MNLTNKESYSSISWMTLGRMLFSILTWFSNNGLNDTIDTLKISSSKREIGHCFMILNSRTLKENLTHIGWALMKLRKYLIMGLFRLKPLMMGMSPSWWMGTNLSYIKKSQPKEEFLEEILKKNELEMVRTRIIPSTISSWFPTDTMRSLYSSSCSVKHERNVY